MNHRLGEPRYKEAALLGGGSENPRAQGALIRDSTGVSLSHRNAGGVITPTLSKGGEPGSLRQEKHVVFPTKVPVIHGQFLKGSHEPGAFVSILLIKMHCNRMKARV